MKFVKILMVVFFLILIKNKELYSQQLNGEKKNTVLYFHTDWCSYCGMQSKQIEKDSLLNSILKTQYNFIEFNAESLDNFTFNGKIYKAGKNKTHEFAKYFFSEKQANFLSSVDYYRRKPQHII